MAVPNDDRSRDASTIPTGDEAPRTIADVARVAQGEHTHTVELLMATISMCEEVQQRGDRINYPNLRQATGKALRMSAAMHAVAVADLMDCAADLEDADRALIDELEAYAKEIEPQDE